MKDNDNAPGVTRAQYLLLGAELALIALVVQLFNIEGTRGFGNFIILVVVAFLVHTLLPARYRHSFFLLTAVCSIFLLLWSNGLWLIGVALPIVTLLLLPIAFRVKVMIAMIVAVVLVLLRTNLVPNNVPVVVWPILGSMFMFRVIIYLYDIRHEKVPAPLAQRITYFFLPPNIFFPFFPVVDYAAYKRSYYNDDAWKIYQKGVYWICQGILHLLLYRLVYHNLTVPIVDINDVGSLSQFLVFNFLLYLRVSGQFHVILGVLCLFGYNLPRTHNLYFLASGFNDFWRRINIYWKDFMMKCFYYPLYMRIRGIGPIKAMIVATIFVFFCTWLLHVYQWFWLRGDGASFNLPESLFWWILGALVVINSVLEYKYGKKMSRARNEKSSGYYWLVSLKTAAMFMVMCVLWSLFTAPGMAEWLLMWNLEGANPLRGWHWVLLTVVAAITLGFVVQKWHWGRYIPFLDESHGTTRTNILTIVTTLLLLLALGKIPALGMVNEGNRLVSVISSLQSTRLNEEDNKRQVVGYYEGLVNVNQFTRLAEIQGNKPRDWVDLIENTKLAKLSGQFGVELLPDAEDTFKGVRVSTNRWGMRDRDYSLEKPARTARIAIVGGSEVFGDGVRNEEVYENLLEDRLNRDNDGRLFDRYELLNFSAPGYFVIDRLIALREKALGFDPDYLFYIGHRVDTGLIPDNFSRFTSWAEGYLPEYLGHLAEKLSVFDYMFEAFAQKSITPYSSEIQRLTFEEVVKACREKNIVPVFVYEPVHGEEIWDPESGKAMIAMAKEAGFVTVDLTGAFRDYQFEEMQLTPWDYHKNVLAHRLTADKLYETLKATEVQLNLGL